MYSEDTNISFITLTNSDEGFIDILDDFSSLLDNELCNSLEVEVTDIFPTSISITIKGNRFDILDAIGQITQLLVSLEVFSFHFTLHTVETSDVR